MLVTFKNPNGLLKTSKGNFIAEFVKANVR